MTTSLRKSSSPRSSYKSLKTSEDDVSSIKGAHIPTSAAASDDNNNNNNNSNSNQSSSRSVSSSSSPSSSAETKTRAERLADKIQARELGCHYFCVIRQRNDCVCIFGLFVAVNSHQYVMWR